MLVNSVPLSLTIISGRPRRAITASSSRPTLAPDSDVSATRAMHSRVKSSTTASMRNRRLSVSVSLTKSSDQRWFGALRQRHRSPCSQRSLASTTPANLKPFLGIQTPQLLVIDRNAFAAEQEKQAAIAKPPPDSRQLAQPCANDRIVGPHAAIAHRGSIRPDHCTRPPLADLKT